MSKLQEYIVKLFLNTIGVIITQYVLSGGIHVQSFGYAVIVAIVLSLLNIAVKPMLIFLTLPATLISLGLFLLVINAFIILIADWLITPGFTVDSFWWALGFSIVLSIINSFLERLTVKAPHREDAMKVFDKDGKRIL